MDIRIEIDLSDLNFDIDKVESAIEKELVTTGYKIEGTAKELAPIDTGILKGSITCQPDGLEVDVFTNVDYSVFMEYGTAPHMIGNRKHPGTRPYLYMSTAFDSHTEDLDVRIADIIGAIL